MSYVDEPMMVQKLMDGPEFSIDILCDGEGRCLNSIPRTMIESGGESVKGTVIDDHELIELGRAVGKLGSEDHARSKPSATGRSDSG